MAAGGEGVPLALVSRGPEWRPAGKVCHWRWLAVDLNGGRLRRIGWGGWCGCFVRRWDRRIGRGLGLASRGRGGGRCGGWLGCRFGSGTLGWGGFAAGPGGFGGGGFGGLCVL